MKEIRIRVINPLNRELRLVLEPLGEIHSDPSNESLILKASGDEPQDATDCLEVEVSQDTLTIYAWRSALVKIDDPSDRDTT